MEDMLRRLEDTSRRLEGILHRDHPGVMLLHPEVMHHPLVGMHHHPVGMHRNPEHRHMEGTDHHLEHHHLDLGGMHLSLEDMHLLPMRKEVTLHPRHQELTNPPTLHLLNLATPSNLVQGTPSQEAPHQEDMHIHLSRDIPLRELLEDTVPNLACLHLEPTHLAPV